MFALSIPRSTNNTPTVPYYNHMINYMFFISEVLIDPECILLHAVHVSVACLNNTLADISNHTL